MKKADLHIHSTASDGSDAPGAIAQLVQRAGLDAFALTDHDTIDGLEEAEEAARDLGLEFVRGCEVSARTPHSKLHIVGLWLPQDSSELENFLKAQREARKSRNLEILRKLARLGLVIDVDELNEGAVSSPGRPHIAKIMLRKGYVQNLMEAFSLYLGASGSAYVPKPSADAEEVVKLMKKIGATPVIAHPWLYGARSIEADAASLARSGLDALEAWHSSQDEAISRHLEKLAAKLGLGISAGSDYHGAYKPGIQLGHGHDNQPLPAGIIEQLKKRRTAQGLPC